MVAQMHALGVMLLSFGASLYALDYLVRHVALCSERIFFLSPLPRWKMAGLHGCVLWSFCTPSLAFRILVEARLVGVRCS